MAKTDVGVIRAQHIHNSQAPTLRHLRKCFTYHHFHLRKEEW
jgi:hypothetical protein